MKVVYTRSYTLVYTRRENLYKIEIVFAIKKIFFESKNRFFIFWKWVFEFKKKVFLIKK